MSAVLQNTSVAGRLLASNSKSKRMACEIWLALAQADAAAAKLMALAFSARGIDWSSLRNPNAALQSWPFSQELMAALYVTKDPSTVFVQSS